MRWFANPFQANPPYQPYHYRGTRIDQLTDFAVETAHDEIGSKIRAAIGNGQERVRDATREAEGEREAVRGIEQAVRKGEWWKLHGVLDQDEVELMSEIEPSDRGSLLREPE